MKTKMACLLNGGDGDPGVDKLTDNLAGQLASLGWAVDIQVIRSLRIAPCKGCFACWVATPGVCIIDDDGRDVARRVVQSDLAAFITPVTFGGYSSILKHAVDRLIPLILPYFRKVNGEVHHVPRYESYPSLLGVGLAEEGRPDAERIFGTVVKRNAINMQAPRHAACVVPASCDDPRVVLSTVLPEVTA